MFRKEHLIADFKQLKREPILLLFASMSLIYVIVFRLIIVKGAPLMEAYFSFDLLVYIGYILSMVYLLQPIMLGTVIGFFMLDEKDAKIFELLRVTPLGYSGYLLNRLFLPVVLTIVYTLLSYFVLAGELHSFATLIPILFWLSIQTLGVGMFIAIVSDDKVKGLTYAKAVSGLMLFGFVDLIPIPLIKLLGRFTPYYYVTQMIFMPSLEVLVLGTVVHVMWLMLIFNRLLRNL